MDYVQPKLTYHSNWWSSSSMEDEKTRRLPDVIYSGKISLRKNTSPTYVLTLLDRHLHYHACLTRRRKITLHIEHVITERYSSSTRFPQHTYYIFIFRWSCHDITSTPNLWEWIWRSVHYSSHYGMFTSYWGQQWRPYL